MCKQDRARRSAFWLSPASFCSVRLLLSWTLKDWVRMRVRALLCLSNTRLRKVVLTAPTDDLGKSIGGSKTGPPPQIAASFPHLRFSIKIRSVLHTGTLEVPRLECDFGGENQFLPAKSTFQNRLLVVRKGAPLLDTLWRSVHKPGAFVQARLMLISLKQWGASRQIVTAKCVSPLFAVSCPWPRGLQMPAFHESCASHG